MQLSGARRGMRADGSLIQTSEGKGHCVGLEGLGTPIGFEDLYRSMRGPWP
jgi:hypothetical protein